MPNALSDGGGLMSPEAPAQMRPQPNPPQQGAPMPQQGPPRISRKQAVAGLRHFDAISKAMQAVLKDPGIGKSDVKSKVIDAATELVAKRIMSPAEAVTQLGTFPKDPQDQRKWVANHLAQAQQGMIHVLDISAMSGPHADDDQPNADTHLEDMADMMKGFKGRK